jgi:signal transduction protein with GAF and PtsI domain
MVEEGYLKWANDTIEQLRAELDEWQNAKKFVADGCTDEIHCGCVPILKRELDAKTKAVKEAREIMNERWFMVASTKDRQRIERWLTAHPEGKE